MIDADVLWSVEGNEGSAGSMLLMEAQLVMIRTNINTKRRSYSCRVTCSTHSSDTDDPFTKALLFHWKYRVTPHSSLQFF
jgi:hypothetical protein